MAQYPKEQLEKLLKFLNDEVIHEPANAWFVDKLYKLLPQEEISHTPNQDIKNIEKYLGLDFKLDALKTHIDYSFIKDDYLRDCFEADWREMLRYRFGTRRHSIEFREFCRYAMLQIERFINYYYFMKGHDIIERVGYIQKFNPTYKPKDKNGNEQLPPNVEAIPFSFKFWALDNEFNIDKNIKSIIGRISKVRNAQSHGSSQPNADENFFNEHKAYLIRLGLPLKNNGLVDWKELSKNAERNAVYNNTIKYSPEHQRYIDLEWEMQQPFEEVLLALSELIDKIRANL